MPLVKKFQLLQSLRFRHKNGVKAYDTDFVAFDTLRQVRVHNCISTVPEHRSDTNVKKKKRSCSMLNMLLIH